MDEKIENQLRTENAELRRELETVRERLNRVLDTEGVGALFLDQAGYLTDANPLFLKMTGYTRDQIERRELHWRSMTPPEWIAESEAQMEQLRLTGHIGPYEKEYRISNGTRRWMIFFGRDLG